MMNRLLKQRKYLTFLLFGMWFLVSTVFSQTSLVLHYSFSQPSGQDGVIRDESGNGLDGKLENGASVTSIGTFGALDMGSSNGYVIIDPSIGSQLSTMTDFTVSACVRIDLSNEMGQNGNFIWAFGNSDHLGENPLGGMFFSAKNTRYAISLTNWKGEQGVRLGKDMPVASWKHLVFVQSGSEGSVYLNGQRVSTNHIDLCPKDLGVTKYHYIGRSLYMGDAFLKNAMLTDFRIYNKALSESEILQLAEKVQSLNEVSTKLSLEKLSINLLPENMDSVVSDLTLSKELENGVKVNWSSSNPAVLSEEGKINRPSFGEKDARVVLKAILWKDGVEFTRQADLLVPAFFSDAVSVEKDAASICIKGNINNLRSDLHLPTRGVEGSEITWQSSHNRVIDANGKLLGLSEQGMKKKVVMTAIIKKGNSETRRAFDVYVAEDEGYSAYLFAYFTGNDQKDEAIRFAISSDGFNYFPLNEGRPVIGSDTIALKKAVRDPHILRGHDGKTFYMVVTDMRSAEGWNSNRGIVMLKSTDLVHWSHATVHFPSKWPEKLKNVTRVWAPQTLYDPQAGKYLVYFSLYTNDGAIPYDKIYYCYANADFTDLEGEPRILFDRGSATIDGDIVYNDLDSLYHLFYKNEDKGGICKVTSKTLTATDGFADGSQWSIPSNRLQQTNEAVEGVGVFKLINSDNWVMMYDCYTNGHYQYCISPDLNKFKYVSDSYDIHARHGTTIPVTLQEARRLIKAFPCAALINRPLLVKAFEAVDGRFKMDSTGHSISIPVKKSVDLKSFDPLFEVLPGTIVTPKGKQDFSKGAVRYSFIYHKQKRKFNVGLQVEGNPVIPGFHADPEILFSAKTQRYYIYSTTDGFPGWGGYSFQVFSSSDMVNWVDEGVMLDLKSDQVTWASGNAWAPAIEEKKVGENEYRYYFYFSGESNGKKIGVAVSDHPVGPYKDSGKPLISDRPAGVSGGQQIDVDVFTDPQSGRSYIYWGNGYMAVAELNSDMVSLKEGTTRVITPQGGSLKDFAFREAPYVFFRNGIYYFMWSVDDTGSPNYHVAYGTSKSPLGPVEVATNPVVIIQKPEEGIFGTGHNSVIQIPGTDDWYMVYHRINKAFVRNSPGIHREVCIDKLEFNSDGSIRKVIPTREGIHPIKK